LVNKGKRRKEFIGNSSPPSRMLRISGAGPSPDGMPAGQDFFSRPA
jgi:hypothetical protein